MATVSSYTGTGASPSNKNTIAEDVTDIIYNISPTDTPLLTSVGRRNVGSTTFEWLTESLPAVRIAGTNADSVTGTNAVAEGAAFSSDTAVTQSRVSNITQISVRNAEVTGTQRATSNYGFSEELAHQLTLASRILKNDVEAALVSEQARQNGDFQASATVRKTRGLEHWIQTNTSVSTGGAADYAYSNETTALTDGTARDWTEAMIGETMQTAYEAGAEPSVMMLGPYQKRVLSTFDGRSGTQVQVSPDTVTSNVTLFASDFGDLRVMVNRKQRARTVFLLDPQYASVAFLRPFTKQSIAKVGDTDREQLIVEFGLEVKNEAAHAKIADLTTSGHASL